MCESAENTNTGAASSVVSGSRLTIADTVRLLSVRRYAGLLLQGRVRVATQVGGQLLPCWSVGRDGDLDAEGDPGRDHVATFGRQRRLRRVEGWARQLLVEPLHLTCRYRQIPRVSHQLKEVHCHDHITGEGHAGESAGDAFQLRVVGPDFLGLHARAPELAWRDVQVDARVVHSVRVLASAQRDEAVAIPHDMRNEGIHVELLTWGAIRQLCRLDAGDNVSGVVERPVEIGSEVDIQPCLRDKDATIEFRRSLDPTDIAGSPKTLPFAEPARLTQREEVRVRKSVAKAIADGQMASCMSAPRIIAKRIPVRCLLAPSSPRIGWRRGRERFVWA